MTQLAGYFTNILYKKIAFLFFNWLKGVLNGNISRM
jgi:hypothetical protein